VEGAIGNDTFTGDVDSVIDSILGGVGTDEAPTGEHDNNDWLDSIEVR
jgi:hypothetical protein